MRCTVASNPASSARGAGALPSDIAAAPTVLALRYGCEILMPEIDRDEAERELQAILPLPPANAAERWSKTPPGRGSPRATAARWADLPIVEGKRDRVVERGDLGADIVVADAGIRDVREGDAQAPLVGEPPGDLELGADLEHTAEVEPAAAPEGADPDAWRDDHPLAEGEIAEQSGDAEDRAFAGRFQPEPRLKNPKPPAMAVLDAEIGRRLVEPDDIESAGAEGEQLRALGCGP